MVTDRSPRIIRAGERFVAHCFPVTANLGVHQLPNVSLTSIVCGSFAVILLLLSTTTTGTLSIP